MNLFSKIFVSVLLVSQIASGQTGNKDNSSSKRQKNMPVNKEKLSNTIVKAAIEALEKGDTKAWFALFTTDAELYDDGNKHDFKQFSNSAFEKGHEHFTSIDKVENNGLDIYGHYHSDQWGDFKTYYKFHINKEGKITRLDVGQANY